MLRLGERAGKVVSRPTSRCSRRRTRARDSSRRSSAVFATALDANGASSVQVEGSEGSALKLSGWEVPDRTERKWWAGTGLNRRHQDFQRLPSPWTKSRHQCVLKQIAALPNGAVPSE